MGVLHAYATNLLSRMVDLDLCLEYLDFEESLNLGNECVEIEDFINVNMWLG